MKKQLLFITLVVYCLLMLIGCNNSTKAHITISEDEAEYLADVTNLEHFGEKGNDFIQIVPGVYDVREEQETLFTTIPLKIVAGKKYPSYKVYEFNLYVVDAHDKYIKINDNKVEFKAVEANAAYQSLCKASIDNIVNVTFSYKAANAADLQKISEAIASCEIDLVIQK